MENDEKMSLVNIKEGAAVEMFNRALARVMDNISDINTTLKPREIVLKASFTPTEDRTIVYVDVNVVPKLQGQESEKCIADVKIDSRGRSYCAAREPRQTKIPFNVSQMKGVKQ